MGLLLCVKMRIEDMGETGYLLRLLQHKLGACGTR